MTLLTAHRILIASAIALFAFLAVHQGRIYSQAGGVGSLFLAAASAVVVFGLALYYRTIPRARPPEQS